MMNIIKGSIWIVAFILGINLSFEMISQANTMENINNSGYYERYPF